MYVTKIESNTNTLVVGGDRDSLCQGLKANDWNWISGKAPASEFKALVKIRYKHEPTPCLVQVDSDQIKITFDIPQRAVAPGQAAVIYKWNSNINAREVLGGGKITHAL
jgi:tRNA-specific 2-thiouridylase